MKLKKGDTVIVMIGKDRGKKGSIERVDTRNSTVTVAGVNIYKRHMKKRNQNDQAGIVDIVKPLSVSKVALVCPSCHKPTRIGYVITKGEHIRMCRKCEQRIS